MRICFPAARLVFGLLFLLAACTPAVIVTTTPTRIVPSSGRGGLTGSVPGASERWPDEPLLLFAAPFSGDAGSGKGFYLLEPNIHPKTGLEAGGSFQLNNAVPGLYVLVVGPTAERARLVLGDAGKMRVVEVKADLVLDLGSLEITP